MCFFPVLGLSIQGDLSVRDLWIYDLLLLLLPKGIKTLGNLLAVHHPITIINPHTQNIASPRQDTSKRTPSLSFHPPDSTITEDD